MIRRSLPLLVGVLALWRVHDVPAWRGALEPQNGLVTAGVRSRNHHAPRS